MLDNAVNLFLKNNLSHSLRDRISELKLIKPFIEELFKFIQNENAELSREVIKITSLIIADKDYYNKHWSRCFFTALLKIIEFIECQNNNIEFNRNNISKDRVEHTFKFIKQVSFSKKLSFESLQNAAQNIVSSLKNKSSLLLSSVFFHLFTVSLRQPDFKKASLELLDNFKTDIESIKTSLRSAIKESEHVTVLLESEKIDRAIEIQLPTKIVEIIENEDYTAKAVINTHSKWLELKDKSLIGMLLYHKSKQFIAPVNLDSLVSKRDSVTQTFDSFESACKRFNVDIKTAIAA